MEYAHDAGLAVSSTSNETHALVPHGYVLLGDDLCIRASRVDAVHAVPSADGSALTSTRVHAGMAAWTVDLAMEEVLRILDSA